MLDRAVTSTAGGVLIRIDVRPGAATTRVAGVHAARAAIRVDLAARAERGRANRELMAFVADLLGVRSVEIVKGLRSRHKAVLVPGATREAVLAALTGALPHASEDDAASPPR